MEKKPDTFLLNCHRVWLRPPTKYTLALATKAIEAMKLRKDEDIDIWAEHIAADVADVND